MNIINVTKFTRGLFKSYYNYMYTIVYYYNSSFLKPSLCIGVRIIIVTVMSSILTPMFCIDVIIIIFPVMNICSESRGPKSHAFIF